METLRLKTPIKKGERTVEELHFADAKVRHMLSLDGHENKNSYGADLSLTSALTGEPEELLGEMEPEDWVKVREVLSVVYVRFMGVSKEEYEKLKAEDGEDESPLEVGEGEKASPEL